MSIEPDVSMTNVRLAGGRSASARSAVLTPIRTSRGAVVGARRRRPVSTIDTELAVRRCRVAVVEHVDPLLDADRRRIRAGALVEEAWPTRARAGVDVEGERRLGVVGRRHERRVAAVDEHVVLERTGDCGAGTAVVDRNARRRWPCRRRAGAGIGTASIVHRALSVVVEVRAGVDVRSSAIGARRRGAGAGGEDGGEERREQSDAHGHRTAGDRPVVVPTRN